MRRMIVILTLALILVMAAEPARAVTPVMELSVIPRPANLLTWTARTTSPNGLIIAGECVEQGGPPVDGANAVFIWDESAGVNVVLLPAGAPGGLVNVRAVADDGRALLVNFQGPDGNRAWQWRQNVGWEELPMHADAVNEYSPGIDMSADGSVVLGWNWFERPQFCSNFQFDFRPVIWVDGGAAQTISDWYDAGPCLFGASGGPAQMEVFLAHAIAAYNIDRFAGTGWVFEPDVPARRDHAQTLSGVGGSAAVHGKPLDSIDAVLTAYSPNGSHAIGMADMGTSRRIIRVTDGGPLEELGDSYPNPSDAQTLDYVSNDGKTIMATTRENGGARYVWTEADGWSLVRDWIAGRCVDVLQFEFMFAVGADPDARIVAGNARNFLGEWQIWRLAPVTGPDTDGDGLLDEWEINGLDINQDGTIDLPLPLMGADPMHKDLFVEIDRMRNVPFSTNALDQVIAAFESAPVMNPDGDTGINLWIDYNTIETVRRTAEIDNQFIQYRAIKDAHFGTEAERADSNWDAIRCAREAVFRYCLFADEFQADPVDGLRAGGRAEIHGNDIVVAAGSFGGAPDLDRALAVTFMHELGHSIGLRHGGNDDVNFKPNYVSVMNYGFEVYFDTNDPNGQLPLDYSREYIAPIEESAVYESDGINSTLYKHVLTVYGWQTPGGGAVNMDLVRLNGTPVDFDHDGFIDFSASELPITADLNWLTSSHPTANAPSPGQTLEGFNDWQNIHLGIGVGGNFANSVIAPMSGSELPVEFLDAIRAAAPAGAPCLADVNDDSVVNGADLAALLSQWDGPGSADLTGDGTVDGADLAALLAAWGACP